jgi:uncharacterized protein
MWLILFLFLLSVVSVILAYYQSKSLLYPKRRKPVTTFPDRFQLVYEKVAFRTRDGVLLRGWFVPAEKKSEKTIILLHGWGTNKGHILANTYFLHDTGFNLFYFDFRTSGESTGAVSSVGYLESRDFDAAIKFLRENKTDEAKSIGVYGMSMGAAVAIHGAVRMDDIKCVAVEAAFDSCSKVIGRWAWVNMQIPYFPFVPLAQMFVRMKLKVDIKFFYPIHNISAMRSKAIFFIHGSNDEIVPLKDVTRLYKKANEPKEMWIVPDASHGKCAEVGGKEYQQRLSGFFKKYL